MVSVDGTGSGHACQRTSKVIGVHTGTIAARPPHPGQPLSSHGGEEGAHVLSHGAGCRLSSDMHKDARQSLGVTDKDPALISRAGQTPTLGMLGSAGVCGAGNSTLHPLKDCLSF